MNIEESLLRVPRLWSVLRRCAAAERWFKDACDAAEGETDLSLISGAVDRMISRLARTRRRVWEMNRRGRKTQ